MSMGDEGEEGKGERAQLPSGAPPPPPPVPEPEPLSDFEIKEMVEEYMKSREGAGREGAEEAGEAGKTP